jgi:hypothetical protein
MYVTYRRPELAWEPAPDELVISQVLAWLNQWIRQSNQPNTWKRDPLLETLDVELVKDEMLKPFVSTAALADSTFKRIDGRILQEAVWLRDISRWAHGEGFDDVGRATALFDWTVRNIQLETDESAAPHRPWQILLYGRGSAAQRAWVFALLCRQQGLNVVMLGVPGGAAASPTYWLPALFTKGQFHLFDPALGLPIQGPQGKGVATLEQVLKDDALLRRFDVEGAPYPLTAERLKTAKAFIVADPFELTRRASQLEASLTGEDHLSLAVKPSEIAEQLKGVADVNGVGLWDFPVRTLRDQLTIGKTARRREALAFEPFAVRPALWKARTRHFQGRRKAANEPGGDVLDDHQEAVRLYMSRSVRPSDQKIKETASVDERRVVSNAKINATYWLGLLTYDDGKYEVAADWFRRPELNVKESPWQPGARYNLARSLESQNLIDEAIPVLENNPSAQQQGNKLRARELKSRPKQAKEQTASQ